MSCLYISISRILTVKVAHFLNYFLTGKCLNQSVIINNALRSFDESNQIIRPYLAVKVEILLINKTS